MVTTQRRLLCRGRSSSRRALCETGLETMAWRQNVFPTLEIQWAAQGPQKHGTHDTMSHRPEDREGRGGAQTRCVVHCSGTVAMGTDRTVVKPRETASRRDTERRSACVPDATRLNQACSFVEGERVCTPAHCNYSSVALRRDLRRQLLCGAEESESRCVAKRKAVCAREIVQEA